jgi:gamma-aminobutyric acid type B receptor
MFTKQHFPNFFRVVPSENAFNAPRLKLLQEFNWTRVGTIYQNEPRYSLVSSRSNVQQVEGSCTWTE